jgi:methionyl-tRNA formyltransferase
MEITILVDNESWIIPYCEKLKIEIIKLGHNCKLVKHSNDIKKGDLLILLGCIKLFKNLNLNTNNIVIHESDLPKGKGWSPLTWQILEGKNEIPITLFEANDKLDSGIVYLRDTIKYKGHELFDEIKDKQGEKTIEMVLKYINNKPIGFKQIGDITYYNKRTPQDSEIDINKPIIEQINLLRVCDNTNYPAFFKVNNQTYILRISKNN